MASILYALRFPRKRYRVMDFLKHPLESKKIEIEISYLPSKFHQDFLLENFFKDLDPVVNPSTLRGNYSHFLTQIKMLQNEKKRKIISNSNLHLKDAPSLFLLFKQDKKAAIKHYWFSQASINKPLPCVISLTDMTKI